MTGRILLLCGLLLMSGCSARWHARQAQKHIEKAKAIDPTVSLTDTVVVLRDTVIETPAINADTLVDQEQPTDTATAVLDGIKVKTTYDPVKKKQWIKVEKPAKKDTLTLKDKIITETIVVPDKPWYKKIPLTGYFAGGFILLAIIGSVIRKIFF